MSKKLSAMFEPTRANEWWEFKIASILGTAYATAIVLEVPFDSLLAFLGFLLVSLIPGAVFVSLINDLTDLEDDRIAGKKNRLEGKSKTFSILAILLCLIAGVVVCLFLQKLSLVLYLCAWGSYTLYSVPPFRLKKHGFLGVLADALGANVFPQLFTVAVLGEWFGKNVDWIWFSAVGVWSLCWGLRGILYHQLKDKDSDKKSNTKTFVQRHKVSFSISLGKKVFFPIEVLAFIFILIYSMVFVAFIALGLYLVLEGLRHKFWNLDIVIVNSTDRYRLFLLEHYSVFYPIGFLISGLELNIFSIVLLVLHFGIFFNALKRSGFEGFYVSRDCLAWVKNLFMLRSF